MDPGPVKIFTVRDVPRLRYIAEIILGDILGLSWDIVTDKRKLGKNPVINYSRDDIRGAFKIIPHGLLSEVGVKDQKPVVSEWKGLPVFFQVEDNSDIPFDIFSASFFLVSRYEEYLDFEVDKYGRFPASQSFAYRNGFLLRPIVDLWARELAKTMLPKFQSMTFRKNTFSHILTFDVDQPFAYLGKDLIRSIGGFIKEIGNKTGKVNERYRTLTKGEKDPYDVFDYILEKIGSINTNVRFFIPTGDRSSYDKNPSWHNEDYRKLIGKVAKRSLIGLHPSVEASVNAKTLLLEKSRLEEIISSKVNMSRFHFIKMRFPESFRNLISEGITEDYSIGFPDEPGFRAGLARPYYFYDLFEDRKSLLLLFPFQVMDMTLMHYKGMTPEESDRIIAAMIEDVRKVGGLFISLWHNTSLLESPDYRKWRITFESMIKLLQV